jgi:uncharacterized ion transporter superfamily protein YfcC
VKRSKEDLKYRRDMKKTGWKIEYDSPGGTSWSMKIPKETRKAMMKASREGEKARAKRAKEWLISFLLFVVLVILLNGLILGGLFGKVPSVFQLFIGGMSLIGIVGQILDRKNKIGEL